MFNNKLEEENKKLKEKLLDLEKQNNLQRKVINSYRKTNKEYRMAILNKSMKINKLLKISTEEKNRENEDEEEDCL